MALRRPTCIVTYYALDGACAAAAALLKYPGAEIHMSSATRIAETLVELAGQKPASVHVCGLGVYCEWRDLEAAAEALRKSGAKLHWYCGRGYLDDRRAEFAALCTPHFVDAGSNTRGVAEVLKVTDTVNAEFLRNLAAFDPNLGEATAPGEPDDNEKEWLDLVEASWVQYAKFQDAAPYARAIRQLAENALDRESREMIGKFRQTGTKYIMHGRTAAMRKLKALIQRCASIDRPVVITGESGVGKEHVANLLREGSTRANQSFVPINCAMYAGSAGLANSDLFGHVAGAFTGATHKREGRFSAADGGILFFDEVGELPLEVQAKLLRVIEDGVITPEGADKPLDKRVNVRVFAATNRDLPKMMAEGTFRVDLYHRLATLRIHVPPLRERIDDVRLIAEERVKLLQKSERGCRPLTKADYAALCAYRWPGNVRQLIKVVERAMLLGTSVREALEEERRLGEVLPDDGESATLWPEEAGAVRPIEEIRRAYARRAWQLHQENTTVTANALGISPNTLRGLLKE